METLTNQEFKNYLKGLRIIKDCNNIYANDEVGEVLTVNTLTSNIEFNDACIDGVEYELTEKQKQSILSLTDGFEEQEASEEMTHFEFYTQIYN